MEKILQIEKTTAIGFAPDIRDFMKKANSISSRLFAFAALALLISSLSFAQMFPSDPGSKIVERPQTGADIATDFETACQERSLPGGWMVAAVIAIILTSAIIGLAYVASGAFGNPRVGAWAKNAFLEMIVSAVIIAIFAVSWAGLNLAGLDLLESGHFTASLMKNTVQYDLAHVTLIDVLVNLYGNLNVSFGVLFTGVNFSTKTVFKPISDALGIVINALAAAVLEWNLNLFILCFSRANLMGALVPVAVFLRAFHFSRGAGNVLLAVSAALFFVYPFMLSINGVVLVKYFGPDYEQMQGRPVDPNDPNRPGGAGGVQDYGGNILVESEQANEFIFNREGEVRRRCEQVPCFFRSTWSAILEGLRETGVWFGIAGIGVVALGLIFSAGAAAVGAVGIAAFHSLIVVAIIQIMMKAAQDVFIASIILPLFNIFITFTFIKEFAKYLGSEIDLSALEKIF